MTSSRLALLCKRLRRTNRRSESTDLQPHGRMRKLGAGLAAAQQSRYTVCVCVCVCVRRATKPSFLCLKNTREFHHECVCECVCVCVCVRLCVRVASPLLLPGSINQGPA